MQTTLFGRGSPHVHGFVGLRRTLLPPFADRPGWIDHVPGFLLGEETLFHQLVSTLQWTAQRRWMYDREVDVPRLLCKITAPSPQVQTIQAVLEQTYQRRLPMILAALYRDGNDSVAWHADRVGHHCTSTVVAVVSLGSSRRFVVRTPPEAARADHVPSPGSTDPDATLASPRRQPRPM